MYVAILSSCRYQLISKVIRALRGLLSEIVPEEHEATLKKLKASNRLTYESYS